MASKPKSIKFKLWVWDRVIPAKGKNFAKFIHTAVAEKLERDGDTHLLPERTGR